MLRSRGACACAAPRPLVREVRRPIVRAPRLVRDVAEDDKPKRPRGAEPVILEGGPGSKCRPFLKIEKDAEKFAACNALADEIGEINTPKKAFRIIEDAIGAEVN